MELVVAWWIAIIGSLVVTGLGIAIIEAYRYYKRFR